MSEEPISEEPISIEEAQKLYPQFNFKRLALAIVVCTTLLVIAKLFL